LDEYEHRFRIFDQLVFDNKIWFGLEYIIDNDTTDTRLKFTNQNDGLWARISCSLSTCPTEIWALYPALIRDSFITIDSQLPYAYVSAVDTTISVPAGVFTCYGYRWYTQSAFGDFIIYYLSPDIGLVRKETYSPGPIDAPYLRELWVLDYTYLTN
jgi:hypothetical protein